MPNQPAPGRPSAPAIWVGLILVSLLVLTATLGRPIATPDRGGAGWLPADGHRQRFTGPDGVEASEWAIDSAPALLASGPVQFGAWLSVTEVDWQTAQLVRLSTVRLDPAGHADGRSDNLFSIGPDGVRAEVVSGFDGTSLVYSPGRLELPDNLAAGRSWTSEGAVLVTDATGGRTAVGYRAEYAATSPAERSLVGRGCVVVTLREQLGENPAAATVRTWCRRAGFITFAAGDATWRATAAQPAGVTPDVPFDWADADRLAFTERRINHPISIDQPGSVQVSPLSPPGLLPDGTAVFANNVFADLLAVQTGTDPPSPAWWARPGLRNSAAATFGDTTVAAGLNRQLVAYGPAGEWLWEARLPDLTVAPPVRLADTVVVGTLDGSVTSYDLATGTRLWQQRLPAEVRSSPVVARNRVLAVDQGGTMACFDAAGAEQWATEVGRVTSFAVTPGPEPVVVVPNADGHRVTGLSLADGSELWRPRIPASALNRDVIALAGVVLLRGEDQTIGVDPATGSQLWSWRARRTFAGIGGGNRALLLAADRLILLDDHGAEVTEWPVAIGDAASVGTWLVATGNRVLLIGPKGTYLGVTR